MAEGLESSSQNGGLDGGLARDLAKAWQSLQTPLSEAFSDIFPETRPVAEDRIRRFEELTGLPSLAWQPPRIEVAKNNSRVFVPTIVLENFFEEALRNLKTSAFANWSDEQKEKEAKVSLSMKRVEDTNGRPFLEICMTDNGPLHSEGKPACGEHGRALREIAVAVNEYGGRLEWPTPQNETTQIKLILHHRVLELPK